MLSQNATPQVFLGARDTHVTMSACLRESRSSSLAIAYWGKGAIKALGIDKTKGRDLRVLCDLFSGACNPDELKRLLHYAEVKSLDNLHAKVACFDKAVMVGSSNASSNGLGFEGNDNRFNIEANVLLQDAAVVGQARCWFDALWSDPRSRPVNDELAESVRPLWRYTQRQKHRQESITVLDSLARGTLPEAQKIFLIVYRSDDVLETTAATYKSKGLPTYTQAALSVYPHEEPYYEDTTRWPVAPGTTLIDFQVSRANIRPAFGGIWRVRQRGWSIPVIDKGYPRARIILCDPQLDIDGYRLPPNDVRVLADAIRVRLNEENGWHRASAKTHHFLINERLDSFCKVRGLA